MRTILLAIVVAALPASVATAEQASNRKSDKSATSGKLLPVKGAGAGKSCAAFGPGFVKVDGTDTCVKIGGAFSIGVGSSSGVR
jgi:Porin subfamily